MLAAIAVVSAVCAYIAPAASAGTYGISASGASFCALGHFISNAAGFGSSCDDAVGETFVDAPTGESSGGARELFEIDSPSGALTITDANPIDGSADLKDGYGGGTYWNGGGSTNFIDSGPISSLYWGFQIVCNDVNYCAATETNTLPASVVATGVQLTVTENSGPSLSASGLWSQTGEWIWNPVADPWSLNVGASDPSGVCGMSFTASSQTQPSPAQGRNSAGWQQCPNWTWNTTLDTDSYDPTSGVLPLTVSATNAAGVVTSASENLNVDNVKPSVSISPSNDSNPGGWAVNHSVGIQVKPNVGPSGLASVTCTDDLNNTTTAVSLKADQNTPGTYDGSVDGNGSHTISCSAANNAVDPQGVHNSGSTSSTLDIDEQPPSVGIEPENPASPDQVIADTSDSESPVSGGSIQIAPQGSSSWTALPTTLTSDGQLVATIPDASLAKGSYSIQAVVTSQVGNTGTATESLLLPLRTGSSAIVSFAKIIDPLIAKKVTKRVLVGWHWVKEKKHGKTVRVKVGGHKTTITVIKRVEQCKRKKVKVARHRWKLKTVCAKPHVQYKAKQSIGWGKKSTVYGELVTAQDVAIANQPVTILTAPNNGKGHYTAVGSTTTNATGGWKITLPAGPSRIVKATYAGSATQLPISSIAHVYVQARIKITATPSKLPWTGTTTIRGQLEGRYLPADGVAMRLLIKLPGRKQFYSPAAFRTTKTGSFSIAWRWGSGSGVAKYPFRVATTSNESDYPYTAARSKPVDIEFGVRTPKSQTKRRTRKHHKS